ncbi:MAG TPA: rRNA maturation RNase YbeY [Candidatus Moranbacteria bacterium]|nr:rRNA maturation RNase YbeY [Candidatus Moranbacteria bacterium]
MSIPDMPSSKPILEINNLTQFAVEDGFFEKVARETLSDSRRVCLAGKDVSISVALVSEGEIAGLNKRYREKDRPTDVLSFCEYADSEDLCNNEDKDVFLGEIILCPQYITRSAKEQEVSFEFELAYIFSHGILHLLDFSHGKEMFSKQEETARRLTDKKIKNI